MTNQIYSPVVENQLLVLFGGSTLVDITNTDKEIYRGQNVFAKQPMKFILTLKEAE